MASFKKDHKREARGRRRATLDSDLRQALLLLMNDDPLPPKYRDHALTGEWKEFRDCHVRPDLVLIYCKSGDDLLDLVRLGSHSELGF